VAINAYGKSSLSLPGNGGKIVLVPDAPTNLQNNPAITSKSVISFTWSEGSNNGGSDVIDYRISYDQATGSYVELADSVVETSFTTSIMITSGQIYKFMIEARNSVGYSPSSIELSILAA
jgi:hypothetical protein